MRRSDWTMKSSATRVSSSMMATVA